MTLVEHLRRVGILRKGTKEAGFRYVYAQSGRSARHEAGRISSLKVPPGWRQVAVHPSPQAPLQAVGRDAAGRWQYVYHPDHVARRERRKHARLIRFGRALPRLRAALDGDLRRHGLPRDKVLATVVSILSHAFIRPGSEVYAAENGSYGIATLRRKHLTVRGDVLRFDFPAKSGKRQQFELCNRRIARIVRRILELPGYEVFKYLDDQGAVVDVRRAHITDYIHRKMGEAFSAKDFRTWAATLFCACSLAHRHEQVGSATSRRRCLVNAIKETALRLGNTPAVCRQSYISPAVVSAFESGRVIGARFENSPEHMSEIIGSPRAARCLVRLLKEEQRNRPRSETTRELVRAAA